MSEFYFKAGGRTATPQLSALAPRSRQKSSFAPSIPLAKGPAVPPNLSYSLVFSCILSHIPPKTSTQPATPQFPPNLSHSLTFSRILSHIPPRTSTQPAPPNFPQIARILSPSLVSSRPPPKTATTCRPPNFPQIARILSCPLARLPQHVRPTPPPFPKTKLLALPFAFCYTANCRDRPQETTGWRYHSSNAARGAGRRSFPTFSEP